MTNMVQTADIQASEAETMQKSDFWSVTLLVSGTCIGGGMLALPVQTAHAGFFLSSIGILLSWVFMTYTGLLLVEATLWIKNETHFSSLSRILIGNGARLIALATYMFMNYTSLVAYTAGGARLVGLWAHNFAGISLSYEMSCVVFTMMFASLIYLGAKLVGRINLLFMGGLITTYIALVFFDVGHINAEHFVFRPAWREGLGIFSMILATFSYQMIVPSLCYQLNYDSQQLKKAVITGTTIPCVVYLLWLFIIHGVVPADGANGLKDALAQGASVTEALRVHVKHWSLTLLSDLFALFAVVTSYLGLSLALFFFLKDCFFELKVKATNNAIIMASIVPTLLLSMLFPKALINCLDMSGAYGDTILSGLIPVTMVWIGRYKMGKTGDFRVPGGKVTLSVVAAFYAFIMLYQIFGT